MFIQVTAEKCFPFWSPAPKCVKLMYHLILLLLLKSKLEGDNVAVVLRVLFRWLFYFVLFGEDMLIKASSSVIEWMEAV